MGLTPQTIDRLHAQLLTSGVQQQNPALFQVVDQLINAVREALAGVVAITGGGGGGGGGIFGQSFVTGDNDSATLPNSLQLLTHNLNFNRQGNKLTINSALPFMIHEDCDCEAYIPLPGPQGPRGPAGMSVVMIPGDYVEEHVEVPYPLGDLTENTVAATIRGFWTFNRPISLTDGTDTIAIAEETISGNPGLQFNSNLYPNATDTFEIGQSTRFWNRLYTNGVRFPATPVPSTNVNELDYYEEGSWTPVVSFGGSTVGITYGQQAGEYIKIGKFVVCFGLFVLTSKGAAVGAASLDGLPFTLNNDGAGGITCSKVGYTLFTAGVQEVGLQAGGSGGTSALPVKSVGGTNTGMTDADFTNTCAMILYLCYKADS